ncbi:hypothetical protein HMPREF3190_00599 [Umbribacter vaginalis]|nr:hypothetical protein HMPREF3190_00599 [Coriobacteriales bacterium DNF00809]
MHKTSFVTYKAVYTTKRSVVYRFCSSWVYCAAVVLMAYSVYLNAKYEEQK